jgi:hypothetical protein
MTKTQLVPGMIAALCAALLSTSALAQSNRTAGQDSGFYIGAAFGSAKHDLKKADFGPVGGVQPSLDQSDRAGKVFGGYRVNSHLAVEAQSMDFGSATDKKIMFCLKFLIGRFCQKPTRVSPTCCDSPTLG